MDIDRLDIVISAEASKAEKQLNGLYECLGKLSSVLGGMNTSGLNGLANSVQKLSSAMQGMSSVKTADFTKLANNIQKLAGIDTKGLNSAASSMSIIGKALTGLGGVAQNAQQIGEMAKNLSKFGNKGTQNAIDNMPKLATALENLVNTVAKTPTAVNSVTNLSNALASLASQAYKLKGIGTSVNSIGSAVPKLGSSSVAVSGATKQSGGLSAAFGKLKSSMDGISSSSIVVGKRIKENKTSFIGLTGSVAALTAAYTALKKSLGSFIEKSMDYVEVLNYFDVAFGAVGESVASQWKEAGYDSAEEYVNSFSERAKQLTSKMTGMSINNNGTLTPNGKKSLGMDPEQLMNYQAGFAQMSNSIGVTAEMSLKLSNALTMLGADLASVKNMSFASAWNNLQSGMAGMSRAVDKFGINIRNVNLEQKAAELGYNKVASAMNQNEKEMLRVIIMLESTKYAWGDMAETLNAPANQLRLLQQNFANLARMIGNIFLPVVAKVLPYINGLVIAMQRLFSWIGALLGLDFSGLGNIGGDSSGLSNLLDDAEAANGAVDDSADALEKANKAAKKLKRTIFGFDEMNVLNDNDTSDSGLSSSGSGGKGTDNYDIGILEDALSKAIEDYQKAWDEAFSRMENKANDFADKVEKAFKKIWKTAEPTRKAIANLWHGGFKLLGQFSFDTLKDFWNNFLKPIGNWAIGNDSGLPRFFNITNNLLNEINWSKLKNSLADFYSSLQKLTKFSWTALMDFYESFLKPIAVWTMSKAIPQLVDALADFNNKIHWNELNASLKNFWDALDPFAMNVGQGLVDFFTDLLDVGGDFINNVVPGGLNSIAEAIKNISPETARNIGEGLGKLAVAIGGLKIVQSIAGLIGKDSPFNKGLTFLGEHKYFGIAGGILGVVGALDQFGVIDVDWDWLWEKIGQIKDILAEFIDKIDFETLSSAIGNLWSAFQPFAKGFADGFIEAFDILINDIGAPLINALAKAIDFFAGILGKLDPEFVEGVGVAIGVVAANIKIFKVGKHLKDDLADLIVKFKEMKTSLLGSGKDGLLADAVKETGDALGGLDTAASTASSGGIKKLATSILGEAGAYVAVVALTSELAKLVEGFQGGNGVLSEMGGAINDLAGKLQNTSQITSEHADEIRGLVDEYEDMGLSGTEMADAIMEKFAEWGLSTEQLTGILQSNEYQMGKTSDSIDVLTESARLLAEGMSETKQQLDLSDIDTEVAFGGIRDSLLELRNTNADVNDYFMVLDDILRDQLASSSPNAQVALDAVATAMEEAGIPTDELISLLGERFPGAVQTAESATTTSVSNIESAVQSSMTTASGTVSREAANIQSGIEGMAQESENAVSDSFGNIEGYSGTNWGNSETSVTDALNSMKGASSEKMRQIYANVKSYTDSIWNITANNWDAIGKKVSQVLGEMNSNVGAQTNTIADSFSDMGWKIQNALGNMYDIGRNAAQSFANGFKSVYIPTPHLYTASWNTHYLNAERTRWYQTPNFGVNWYASGGFPNAGELFMARESGPELVGRMGRKNAVANNNQIVDGIKAGVYQAVRDAIQSVSGNGKNSDQQPVFNIYVGGKKVTDVVIDEVNKRTRSTGKCPILT